MATFHIGRKTQTTLMNTCCIGLTSKSRQWLFKLASTIKDEHPVWNFNPSDINSFDLSLLLEKLTDDEHADIFETFLNTVSESAS